MKKKDHLNKNLNFFEIFLEKVRLKKHIKRATDKSFQRSLIEK
jgi:hypothetical protein